MCETSQFRPRWEIEYTRKKKKKKQDNACPASVIKNEET